MCEPAASASAPAGADATGAALPAPTEVTLFLTSACNLRCVYCYASGGDHSRFLDPEIAFDAVDLVVANAVAQGRPEVRVSFHGGGEPTLAGDTLRRSVERARRTCDAQGLRLSTGTATNGVMDDEMRDYLAATMTSVMVSLDGPPEVQARLRPRPGGGPSSAAVERTLARLSESDAVLGVRLTCTAEALEIQQVIEPAPPAVEGEPAPKVQKKWRMVLYVDRCIHCARCAEVCARDAISMDERFELAGFNRDSLLEITGPETK